MVWGYDCYGRRCFRGVWPFPCIKPKFEGLPLPDEVVHLVASFALPPHPFWEAFLVGPDEDGTGVWIWGYDRYRGMNAADLDDSSLRYRGMNGEDPDDSFLANWFGANVLVSLNHMEVILDLRRRQKNKRFVTNVFVNLQFISLFLFFLSNEGYQKILASKPPQPKGLV